VWIKNCADLPSPHEQKQADQGERVDLVVREGDGLAGQGGRLREHGVEIDRARHHKHRKNAKGETEIADPVDDKGLDRRRVASGLWYQKPK